MASLSPFLSASDRAKPGQLALVHLSRDNLVPVILKADDGAVDGYAEGTVINTRFGSFPHSTLINQPWGSQVRASIVDTGSRGRKRKLEDAEDTPESGTGGENKRIAVTASSGFVHLLPPTPEMWTMNLPHRTQVVYTPDYSYILHRIRARPDMHIIEAGAGSGSFTHAAVRAIYSGYPTEPKLKRGKVFSFEFNEDRFHKMEKEVDTHGLKGLVKITHRDVYNDGFLVDGQSPEAESIFLDLPAPWKALPHLSRRKPRTGGSIDEDDSWVSPLRQDRSVHLCSFSPCIEQVTKTVEAMRRLGWVDIEMVEVAHKRVNVLRERIGLNMPAERGTNQSPADVIEAVQRLRHVEGRFREFHARTTQSTATNGNKDMVQPTEPAAEPSNANAENVESGGTSGAKSFMLGRLIHRTEPEIKTHTSYLVFAVLPQEWSEEQEAAALERWPCGQESKVIGSLNKEARKQEKRDLHLGKKKRGVKNGEASKLSRAWMQSTTDLSAQKIT